MKIVFKQKAVDRDDRYNRGLTTERTPEIKANHVIPGAGTRDLWQTHANRNSLVHFAVRALKSLAQDDVFFNEGKAFFKNGSFSKYATVTPIGNGFMESIEINLA